MIGSTRALKVWAYPVPVDLRKGFDGLYGLASAGLKRDPLKGDCFLFVNRTRKRAKVLFWDGRGCACIRSAWSKGVSASCGLRTARGRRN